MLIGFLIWLMNKSNLAEGKKRQKIQTVNFTEQI